LVDLSETVRGIYKTQECHLRKDYVQKAPSL